MAACGGQKDNQAQGVIVDATMNTVTIATAAGDTLSFSTLDAERVAPEGILLGDTATVDFKGKTESGRVTPVSKLVVAPAPRPEKLIVGPWVQPIPGLEGVQGMDLRADGTAASINMSTLLYEKWALEPGELILWGKSVGNGQTIDFVDTVQVEKISADSLVLLRGDVRDAYSRRAE